MYKLQNMITNYRFNDIHDLHGPYLIEWYKLVEEEDGYFSGICFSHEELKKFIDFTVKYPNNFSQNNYSSCSPADCPVCNVYTTVPLRRRRHPFNLIIKPNPTLGKEIFQCMEIVLLDGNGNPNHDYDLDFSVIGHLYE